MLNENFSIRILSNIDHHEPPVRAKRVVLRYIPNKPTRKLIVHVLRRVNLRLNGGKWPEDLVQYVLQYVPMNVEHRRGGATRRLNRIVSENGRSMRRSLVTTNVQSFLPPVMPYRGPDGEHYHFEYEDECGEFVGPACSCTCGIDS